MGKILTFFLPFRDGGILKVETKSRYIKRFMETRFILTQGQRPLKKNPFLFEDFVSRIDLSSKKINRKKESSIQPIRCYSFNNKYGPIYRFSTPLGSYVEINYIKRKARGIIIVGDNLDEYLMIKVNSFILKMRRMTRIHGLWIRKGKTSVLLIGRPDVGKTTLGGLWLKEDSRSKVIEDDSTFVFPENNSVYAFSLKQNSYYPISHLFFVERRINNLSKAYPISQIEAYKRIVFHSDVILDKPDNLVEYRLKTLEKLVIRSRCLVLINGTDLKNNSKKLKKLIKKHCK